MREIAGIIVLLPLVTWFLTHKKHPDIADPYNIYTALYSLNVLIPTFLYADANVVYTIKEAYIRDSVLDNSVYFTYAVLQTICYYLVVFGCKLSIKRVTENLTNLHGRNESEKCNQQFNYKKYEKIGIVLWLIGVFSFFVIMKQVGGVYYFFTHLQYRTSLTRNIDFWTWILPFVNYGTLFVVYSYKGTEKKLAVGTIIMIVLSGIMSGLGGRKALLILFIEAILLYHYCVKKIKIKQFIKPKYVFAAFALYLFFILMSKFRTEGAIESFIQNPILFVSESNNGILSTIRKESYVTFYMTIINHFKSHALWYGRTFWGLITAIVPSSLFPAKPPVDDGAYLYSICIGKTDIIPPLPFSKLDGSSLPLETFGSMYANFGTIGLIFGMIALGGIYGHSYRKMKRNSYDLYDVIIYIQIIFTFQLSTLRIFQLFELIVVWRVVTFLSERVKVKC